MIDRKQELYDDLDQLRDYAVTMKRTAQDILDWCHVIETDMQLFTECRFPDVNPEQEQPKTKPAFEHVEERYPPEQLPPVFPVEPGSPCIDPDGVGCKCYEGCTADCLPSEYAICKCPRKIHKSTLTEPEPEPEKDDEVYYTLTEKGALIVKLISEGYKYLDACRIAETVYEHKE